MEKDRIDRFTFDEDTDTIRKDVIDYYMALSDYDKSLITCTPLTEDEVIMTCFLTNLILPQLKEILAIRRKPYKMYDA